MVLKSCLTYEICGDGLNLGKYECDDGNLNAGDGCDENCLKEEGFSCNGNYCSDT